MRLIATAVVCVLAAFGAAFLIGRAANHQGSATAATAPAHTTSSSSTTTSTTSTTRTLDKALAAQFQPGLGGLRRKPAVHHHRKHVVAAPAAVPTPAAPVTTQSYTAPAPTYTAPAYSPPPRTTAKPTHKGGGSGTTTIG